MSAKYMDSEEESKKVLPESMKKTTDCETKIGMKSNEVDDNVSAENGSHGVAENFKENAEETIGTKEPVMPKSIDDSTTKLPKTNEPINNGECENLDSYGYKKDFRTALPQILAVLVKNITLFTFGCFTGYITILLPAIKTGGYDRDLQLSDEQISWISSINLICVPIGCCFSGWIASAIGRRRALQLVNLPFLGAWLLVHFATTAGQLYAALAVAGITGGLLEAPVMIYVAEISQPHLRGMLASTSTLSVIVALNFQFLCGILVTWRHAALINAAFPVIGIVCLCFIPESPYWLMHKKRSLDSMKSLQWLRGWTTSDAIGKELADIKQSTEEKKSANAQKEKFKLADSLRPYTTKPFFHAYFLVTLGFFLLHFSGMTTIQTYAVLIFESFSVPLDKFYATQILGAAELLGVVAFILFIPKLGKRPMVLFSLTGCAICLVTLTCYAIFFRQNTFDLNAGPYKSRPGVGVPVGTVNDKPNLGWVPLLLILVLSFMSHAGIRILPWILIGEIFCMRTRSTASGISAATAHLFGFAANKLFLGMVKTLSLAGTLYAYALITMFGIALFTYFLPETEGWTLPDIEKHFRGEKKLPNRLPNQLKGQRRLKTIFRSMVPNISRGKSSANK